MPKNRIESFADGIFAFAATLLILNIAVDQKQALGPQLLHNWPSYAAYAISFITIGIIGANHHQLMHQIAHVDRFFLVASVLFLMFIAFIPFPTRLLALDIQTPDAEAAALAYGFTLTGTAVMFNVLWRYAAWHNRLLRPDVDQRVVDGISRSYALGPAAYGIATISALVSPQFSALIYAAIAAFYVVESSIFGRRST
ncbi:MAG TPA: TMEM175 family protein [Candidatus Dormibacteraeota bacterium]|nr:TMEM175 family protein [Candidatus Dormibacteraeota bacterium]